MRFRKTGRVPLLFLLLAFCLLLTGCRTRTTGSGSVPRTAETENGDAARQAASDSVPEEPTDDPETEIPPEKMEAAGERTKENPDAYRKEYDENAPAEIVAGTDRAVHAEGEGRGFSAPGEEAAEKVSRLNDAAEEAATQKVAAEEADRMGVSEDAEEADSAMTYFTVLLAERTGSLFECQRLNAYWETAGDYVTVYKTSPEHSLLLDAGVYDVSARLLEENLRVDDGWISRKNPGVIVKTVDGGVLGAGISSAEEARRVHSGLISREGWAAMDAVRNGRILLLSEELLEAPHLRVFVLLAIAKTAYPELMKEAELGKALEMLTEEATGSIPAGIYFYNGQGATR